MIDGMSYPEYIKIVEKRVADILDADSVVICNLSDAVQRAIDTYAFVDINFASENQEVRDALYAGLNLGVKLVNILPKGDKNDIQR